MSLHSRSVEVTHDIVESVHTNVFKFLLVDSNTRLTGLHSFLGEESGEFGLDFGSLGLHLKVAVFVAGRGFSGNLSTCELSNSLRLNSFWRSSAV